MVAPWLVAYGAAALTVGVIGRSVAHATVGILAAAAGAPATAGAGGVVWALLLAAAGAATFLAGFAVAVAVALVRDEAARRRRRSMNGPPPPLSVPAGVRPIAAWVFVVVAHVAGDGSTVDADDVVRRGDYLYRARLSTEELDHAAEVLGRAGLLEVKGRRFRLTPLGQELATSVAGAESAGESAEFVFDILERAAREG